MFSPDKMVMHYCPSCSRWYHTDCLTDLRTFDSVDEMLLCRGMELGIPLGDLELLGFAFLPIVRGGPYGPGGWGFEQLKARRIVAEQSLGNEWRQSVDPKALKKLAKLARKEKIDVYQCECGNHCI